MEVSSISSEPPAAESFYIKTNPGLSTSSQPRRLPTLEADWALYVMFLFAHLGALAH